ncbi:MULTISPECIES: hypothetical protein [unclassified Lactobacillus]|uniref:hypothetical protein n=1 Tax=unclassified Lactobacillus TaxID=2620435 RepID=UPI0022402062|nr:MULTISPECIES: hypothetical protein [unclassified Lactobacillus]
MENKILSKSKIAEKLGTNAMRVSRFIDRKKITPVKKSGKRELYNLTDFNALKSELSNPKSQSEAQNHGFSKDDYILTLKKQLEAQKQQYEQVVASKDETIASLKETIKTSDKAYEDMKEQLAVKDGQIASLTKLTTNAQTLNLLDKPKQDKEETNSESNVKSEREDVVKEEYEHKGWFKRHFRKK